VYSAEGVTVRQVASIPSVSSARLPPEKWRLDCPGARDRVLSALEWLRTALQHDPKNESWRRQWDILQRYELGREHRLAIARDLGISERTFYYERRAALRRVPFPVPAGQSNPAVPPGSSVIWLWLNNAELLYQAGELEVAAAGLQAIVCEASEVPIKAIALSRLAAVLADMRSFDRAETALAEAKRAVSPLLEPQSSYRGEILASEVHVAAALRAPIRLVAALRELDLPDGRAETDERAWILRARANADASWAHYQVLDLSRATLFAERAATTMARSTCVPPYVRTAVWTMLGITHMYDPCRVLKLGKSTAPHIHSLCRMECLKPRAPQSTLF
jgi:tetratricopeptide (TPR) repeat protein